MWSTTASEFLHWNGSSWQLLRDRANAEVTVVDWFSSTDAQFNGTTINLTIGKWATPPVAYAAGQTILLLTETNEQSYNGVYTLGSVSNLAAVPLTRHADWPTSRLVASGHRFYVRNLYRRYTLNGLPSIEGVTITGDFLAAGVDTVNDRITLDYTEYPQHWEPGTKVRFTTTGTLPAGLSAGVDYYVYYAYRESHYALPRLVIADSLGGTPINLTSTGSGTGTITIQPRWGSNLVHDVGNVGFVTLRMTEWETTFGGTVQGRAAITAHWVFELVSMEPEVDNPAFPANQVFGTPVVAGGGASAGTGVAIGGGATATGATGAIAIGNASSAAGSSIAIGNGSQIAPLGDGTFAYDSIAIGADTIAFGGNSIAVGSGARAESQAVSLGRSATSKRGGVTLGSGAGLNPHEVLLGGTFANNGVDNVSPEEQRSISFQLTVSDATETAALCGGMDGTGIFLPSAYAVLPDNGVYVVDGEITAHDQTDGLYAGVWRLFGVLNTQTSGGSGAIHGYVCAAGGAQAANLKFRFNYDTATNRLELFVKGIATKTTYWRAIVRLRGHRIDPYSSFSIPATHALVAPPGAFLLPASEALTSGQLVSIWSDSGTAKVRQAGRTLIRQADGFVANNYATGELAAVFTEGTNPFASGLTVGGLWLGTSGGVQATSPASGLSQQVGFAISTTSYVFQRGLPIQIT